MNRISFMIANYVARQMGYNLTEGWGQGEKAASDYFQPIDTFAARLDEWLLNVRSMGFDAIDMWIGVVHPDWATEEHVTQAQALFRKHGMAAYSYAGWIGSTPEYFTRICELAVALGIPVLGGATSMLAKDRNFVVDTLKRYGLRLGIENHPEKSVEELLAKVGDGGDGTVGVTVDTGWWGTQGVDAAEALEQLAPHLFLVHLKDVREVGAHNTCRYGNGVVPVERCVRVLQEVGYAGTISVEHEPDHYDPTVECVENLQMLKAWLREYGHE
ncbi:MAG TPA: TIM barrel protein [Chloroflexia bacterium]|nr:TIM barrel protein [Chloroflexia bacterium]